MNRSVNWVFTINNYDDEVVKKLEELDCKYIVYGKEVGESGTPHLQGYVVFRSQRTLSSVKKKFPTGHWEVRRGSHEQASDYCKKDGEYVERGTPPMSPKEKGVGEKRRYEEAWAAAKEGRIEDIDADIRVRHYNTLKKIRSDYQVVPKSVGVLDHEWYWGDSGTGKSKKARDENPGAYLKNPNKWWDGYVDQDVVIIDEWSPVHGVLASHLKQWADHHPFSAETKGSSTCIRPRKLIITSNYHPKDCFQNGEDLEPILRRFKITHFNKLH